MGVAAPARGARPERPGLAEGRRVGRGRGGPRGPRRCHAGTAALAGPLAGPGGDRLQRPPRRREGGPRAGVQRHRARGVRPAARAGRRRCTRIRTAGSHGGSGQPVSSVVSFTLLTEVFVTLFVIMDPVGTIPIFLSLTRGRSGATMRRAAWQAVAVSFAVIVTFAFFGQQILAYLHISLPALQCAGGLLLLLVALELLTGKEQAPSAASDVNIALVPLGTPLLAGPGAIVATMVLSRRGGSGAGVLARGVRRGGVAGPCWVGH